MASSLLSILPNVCKPLTPHQAWMDWALFAVLASPHFLYAWIWFYPKAWQRLFGKQAVDVFAFCGALGKALQFQAVGLWLWVSRSQGLCFDLSQVQLWQWLACLVIGAFGQALNVGIYKAIGKAGVYYGFKLGKKVPWVTGFPFNVVSHPQYVGSVLSVWAGIILLYNQLPSADSLWACKGFTLGVYWTSLYVATGLQEQYL